MLTVATCLWGDWPHALTYLIRLRAGVARHLPQPHRFVVLSDKDIPDFNVLPLHCDGWPRNLRKLALYRPDNGLEGRVLAFDLDTVICGDLSVLAAYRGRFAVLEDLWEPGLCGGGLTGFEAGTLADDLYWPAARNLEWAARATAGGAERHWYRLRYPHADFWQSLHPGLICDAKPITGMIVPELPKGTALAMFHGKPRPHEVQRPWLEKHWVG